jgi:acyl-CoA thioesterase
MKPLSAMTPQEIAEASARSLWEGDTATQELGMRLEQVGPGTATISMTITAAMSNGHGTCHGGYLFTLADSAFAFACNSRNQHAVAQHCSITYLLPGRIGDQLTAQAVEVSRQGRSGIYDVRITNQDGQHLAEFRGHCRTIKGTHIPEE